MRFLTRFFGNFKFQDHKRNKGIAVLWAAITLTVFILFMGLVIDGSRVYLAAHQLQNAADAAALAGAIFVKADPCQAMSKAVEFASLNHTFGQSVIVDNNPDNDLNGEVVIGVYYPNTRIFEVHDDFANAVKVVANRTDTTHGAIPLFFGPIVNVDSANVSRYAIAMSSGGTGAGLIALDCGPAGPGLQMVGNSIVDVGGGPVLGEVVVNCDDCTPPKEAVNLDGGAVIENAAQMNVVGCYDGPETGYPILENDPNNYMPDPLGCWPDGDCLMPRLTADPDNDLSPAPGEPWIPDPCLAVNVLQPGYYSGGITVTSANANIRFEPGIYIVDGEIIDNINAKGGLDLTGGTIDGSDGVMFYILGGSVDIGGGAQVTMNELVPWDGSDGILPYEGMLFYQDPDNYTPARIIGTSDMLLVGTIYFPFNHVEIGGDGYSVGSQLIANSVRVHTSGEGVLINYDGRYRAPGSRSFLVE
ncbi:MAG: pilus assembly protein TadG-related protein [Planctomycetota bacterium]